MENASEQEMAAYLQTLERINELEAMTARIQRENEEMEQVLRAEAAEAQAMREAMENSEDGAVRSNAELQSAMEALMLRARRAQDVTRSASDGPKLASTADPRKLIAMSQAPKATGGRAVPDSSEPRRDYPPKPQVQGLAGRPEAASAEAASRMALKEHRRVMAERDAKEREVEATISELEQQQREIEGVLAAVLQMQARGDGDAREAVSAVKGLQDHVSHLSAYCRALQHELQSIGGSGDGEEEREEGEEGEGSGQSGEDGEARGGAASRRNAEAAERGTAETADLGGAAGGAAGGAQEAGAVAETMARLQQTVEEIAKLEELRSRLEQAQGVAGRGSDGQQGGGEIAVETLLEVLGEMARMQEAVQGEGGSGEGRLGGGGWGLGGVRGGPGDRNMPKEAWAQEEEEVEEEEEEEEEEGWEMETVMVRLAQENQRLRKEAEEARRGEAAARREAEAAAAEVARLRKKYAQSLRRQHRVQTALMAAIGGSQEASPHSSGSPLPHLTRADQSWRPGPDLEGRAWKGTHPGVAGLFQGRYEAPIGDEGGRGVSTGEYGYESDPSSPVPADVRARMRAYAGDEGLGRPQTAAPGDMRRTQERWAPPEVVAHARRLAGDEGYGRPGSAAAGQRGASQRGGRGRLVGAPQEGIHVHGGAGPRPGSARTRQN